MAANLEKTTTSSDAESVTPAPDILPRVLMEKPDWRLSILMLLLCAGIYVPVMGSYGMFDPWETHYTEVARQFMVRNNWMETYWHNGRGPEGFSETNFWSKPVGSFWMSGLSLKLFGYSPLIGNEGPGAGPVIAGTPIEWAVRLPFFLCGLFGIFCIYLMVSRLFSKRAGILSGIVLATCPMYFQITRQAMTDMPYVGLMSGGVALFMLGMFGSREVLPRKSFKLGPLTFDWPHAVSYYMFLVCFVGFMALQCTAIIQALLPLRLIPKGPPISRAVWMGVWIALTLVFIFLSRKTRTKNEIYLYGFYMAVGVAGLAKGLIGALQPGMIILVYLITSREWRMLTDVAMTRGLLIAACIFMPWYHGMVLRFGRSFWNDFFGTEQFRRLTIGEQAQAKGTFEYYVSQIGYGLFPWIAFLPAAVVRAFSLGSKQRTPRDRARLFVFVWLTATVCLFTLTMTKYHHYILPAIPPSAILIALFLDDLLERKVHGQKFLLLASLGLLALVTYDLVKQPAHWVWMYTYLYDSNWSRGVPSGAPILVLGVGFGGIILSLALARFQQRWARITAGSVAAASVIIVLLLNVVRFFPAPGKFILLPQGALKWHHWSIMAIALICGLAPIFLPRLRKIGVVALAVLTLVMGGFIQNWYQLKVAPHWSQKKCIAAYYKMRKGPEEELVAWQFNWRGETWYTGADVVVSKSLDNTAIKQYIKEKNQELPGRRFFFITERSRYPSLRSMLPTDNGQKTLTIVDNTNIHYVLAAAYL